MNEWDNLIKEKLGDFEEAPPAFMWDKIASGIPTTATKIPFYKKTAFKAGVAAAIILLLFCFSWMQNESKKQNTLNLTNNVINNNSNSVILNTNDNKDSGHSNTENNEISKPENKANESNNSSENSNSNSVNKSTDKSAFKSQKTNILANSKIYSTKTTTVSANTNIDSEPIESSQKEISNFIAATENISENNQTNEIKNYNTQPKISAEIASSEIAGSQTSINSEENIEQTEIISQSINNKELNRETATENPVVANEKNEQIINTVEVQKVSENPLVKIPSLDKDSLIISPEEIPHSFQPKHRGVNRIGFGVHYGIESIQINDNQLLSNNLDLSFNFQNLNFILQSGLGIQLSQDVRYYNLEYMRNDYLATELRFDSAVFVQDSMGQVSLVPVNPYYTDVYDSIHHTYNASYYEKYYSIRIPVMIGYQKDFKKIGLFAKGGIFYSRVIYTQKTVIYEPDESSRMIKLNYSGSERVSNQIEYVLSAGIAYRFSKKLHINGEIMTKFYQNSLYDNLTTTNINPWSAEGRLGLLYFIN